jgi:hypothetical protein
VLHAGASYLPIDATIVSRGLLAALLADLLATLGALLGLLGGDIGRRSPNTTWGRARLCRSLLVSWKVSTIPKIAVIAARRSRRYWASQPLAPEGHGSASSVHCACHDVGSVHAAEAACPPDGPIGVLRTLHVGLAVIEPSISRRASRWATAGKSWPELG